LVVPSPPLAAAHSGRHTIFRATWDNGISLGAGATKATFIFDDLTTGKTYDISLTAPSGTSLKGNSAEFIVETPELISGNQVTQPLLSDFLNSPVSFQDVSATYSGGSAASLSSAQTISVWSDDVSGSYGSYVQEAYGSIQTASDSVTVTEEDYWPTTIASSTRGSTLFGDDYHF
jgi:hypothetical protein